MSALTDLFSSQPVLLLAIAGVLLAMWGWLVQHSSPRTGGTIRNAGYLAMTAALLLTVALAAHRADKSDAAYLLAKTPELEVMGDATAIPLDMDGHFRVRAFVNGKPAEFMIDTGATFTSLAGTSASELGLQPTPGRFPAQFDTANGSAFGRFTKIGTLEFGTIRARDLDAVIMVADDGDTNVIGMNLLSKLKSWRVEGKTLTLVPSQAFER